MEEKSERIIQMSGTFNYSNKLLLLLEETENNSQCSSSVFNVCVNSSFCFVVGYSIQPECEWLMEV